MPWTTSRVFREWIAASLEPRAGFSGAWNPAAAGRTQPFRAALFDDTIDTDLGGNPGGAARVATANMTAYANAAGQWIAANEVSDPPGWPVGGLALLNPDYQNPPSPALGFLIVYDADDTGTGTDQVTLDEVYGNLLYDTQAPTGAADAVNKPANPGIAFHYYSGVQRVTQGTFTIIWNVDGVIRAGVDAPGWTPPP